MRIRAASGREASHRSRRRCATRSLPRPASGFDAYRSPTSYEPETDFKEDTVMTIRTLTFGFALALLATAAWGQTRPPGDEEAQRWFRVSWMPPSDGAGTIKGSVFNDSQYRVTDVRLRIE